MILAAGTQYYVYNTSTNTVGFDGYTLFPNTGRYVRFYTPALDDQVIAGLVIFSTVTRGNTVVTGDEIKVIGGDG